MNKQGSAPTSQTDSADRQRLPIALVSFDSLGDSLLYIMMAENLRINGFDVTLFGNVGHALRSWFPQLSILPLPAPAELDAALTPYTLSLVSPPAALRSTWSPHSLQTMKEKWVLLCHRAPETWQYDHHKRLSTQLSPEQLAALAGLPSCSGPIRFREFTTESAVDITLSFMRERMLLSKQVRQVSLSPPKHLEHRKFPHRILVSPDSAGPAKKEWSPSGFLKLCGKLREAGYDPHIVVAPGNHERWKALASGEFSTPLFPRLSDLADFIFESGALIANDSGNGHLASFLGIPVITIYRKRNPHFHWRPGWGPAKVVCPLTRLPWLGEDALWRPFVGTGRILSALKELSPPPEST